MTPKILFTDIDGTLLDKNKDLSVDTIEQIGRINKELSIPVILVSARMPKSMRLLQSQLGLKREIICYNGSLVLGKDDSVVLHDERVSTKISKDVIGKAESLDLHYSLLADDNWIVNRNDEWAQREERITRVAPEQFNPKNVEGLVRKGLHKIMIMGDPNRIDQVQLWVAINLYEEVNFYRSKDTYLEINTLNSTKLTGIKKVLSVYNITLAHAIAIGDNHNDIEMIKFAGIGVAVDNAPIEIKEVADFIAPKNIEHGVAETIRKYF